METLNAGAPCNDSTKQLARQLFIVDGLSYSEIHDLLSPKYNFSRPLINHWGAVENWKQLRAEHANKEIAAIADVAIATSVEVAKQRELKRQSLIEREIEIEIETVERGRQMTVPITNANDLAAWVRAQKGLADLAHMALRIPGVAPIASVDPAAAERPKLSIVAPPVYDNINDWANAVKAIPSPPDAAVG